MLQQPQRKRDIIPLPLGIAPGQPRREFLRELLGMFVLFIASANLFFALSPRRELTFSTKPNKNLITLLKLSSPIS
jgi:hypothetical protein